MLAGKSQPGLHLCSVMTRVEDASPEDPDALASESVEEWPLGQPPFARAGRELWDAEFAEMDISFDVRGNRRSIAGRKQLVGRRFLGPDEFGEKPPFGQQLVRKYRSNRVY